VPGRKGDSQKKLESLDQNDTGTGRPVDKETQISTKQTG